MRKTRTLLAAAAALLVSSGLARAETVRFTAAYYSAATDLVANQNNANNSVQHCFLYDRVANTNAMIDHQFSAATQNEFRVQWNYEHFNVIPNEPAEVGLQIFGFANNLGTNIFLPNLTILRRTEIGDNLSMTRGSHTLKFGGAELLRGNHSESHTFFPGRFVFGSLPGAILSPCLLAGNPNPCGLATGGAFMNSLQAASLGLPQVYQQGFGNPAYPAYTRPYTSLYFQDSWKMARNFTLNYGARYEIDSEYPSRGILSTITRP